MSKKVIVFGGSGFLGSHIADVLSEVGYDVIIYDLKPSPYLKDYQKMIIGDILDERLVRDSVKACDIVYNFAGIADIEEASQRPLDSIRFNILGNSIIMEECQKAKIERFVYASSIYVYSKAGAFYKSTKQACELLIENYHEIYGLPYTILRYGSLYGPRADKRNFIYTILKQALTKGRILRHGDGEELREYIHVHDAARGSVDILSDEFINQYVILTGNQQTRIKDLLVMIREMLDKKIDIEFLPPDKNFHYEITPYSFTPKVGRKLMSKTYIDLNQGILDSINDFYKEVNSSLTYNGITVKD